MLVFALAGVFLFVQSLIRVAVLNFAIVLAPFALLCWVLPQWYWLYSIWMRVLVATFLTQVLQTLAIALGSVLLSQMLNMMGGVGPATPLMAAAMGVATVLAAWSLPKQVVGAWGPSLGLPKMMLAAAATGPRSPGGPRPWAGRAAPRGGRRGRGGHGGARDHLHRAPPAAADGGAHVRPARHRRARLPGLHSALRGVDQTVQRRATPALQTLTLLLR